MFLFGRINIVVFEKENKLNNDKMTYQPENFNKRSVNYNIWFEISHTTSQHKQ